MAYGTVRCAACGSKNVMIDHEQSNFSTKKAVIGTAAIGVLGATAGFIGDKKAVYKCKDCGMELNHCMDTQTALQIDIAVMTGITDENWTQLKKKYSNIENGAVEAMAAAEKLNTGEDAKSTKEFLDNYIQEMRRRWTPEQVSAMVELDKKQREEKENHAKQVEEFDNKNGFIQAREKLNAIVQERTQEAKAISDKNVGIQKQISEKTEEQKKLGLFAGKRKKQIQEEIDNLKKEVAQNTEAHKGAVLRVEQAKKDIQNFEDKRLETFEQAGLSVAPPILTILTDPKEIGNIYSGTYNGGEFERSIDALGQKKHLAKDLINKMILFLAQFEMPVHKMYAVIKKTCSDMGFTDFMDRGDVVKTNQSCIGQVYFYGADGKRIVLTKTLTRRYPTPQFPGHPQMALFATSSQQAKQNPYQIQTVVLTEQGQHFLKSELMYTVLVENTLRDLTGGNKVAAPASWIKTVEEKQKFDEMRAKLQEMMKNKNQAESPAKPSVPETSKADGQIELLEKLAKLHEQGILTDEEFKQKKADLLAKM